MTPSNPKQKKVYNLMSEIEELNKDDFDMLDRFMTELNHRRFHESMNRLRRIRL